MNSQEKADYPMNETPLGKYGRMAVSYLEQKKPLEYSLMFMSGKLMEFGHKKEKEAWELQGRLMKEYLEKNSVPETQDILERTKHHNSLKLQVEEIVKEQVIYS